MERPEVILGSVLPTPPTTRETVAVAIYTRHGYSQPAARQWVEWFLALEFEQSEHFIGRGVHYLSYWEMRRRHDLLGLIMPDNSVSAPGTIHAMLEELVSAVRGRPTALTHGKTHKSGVVRCHIATYSKITAEDR